MKDIYEECPQFRSGKYLLRQVREDDCADLLRVYKDVRAVPFFNSDNCHGDDFFYTTEARMRQAIEFWLQEYRQRGFVRWAIADQAADAEAVGTIELFRRNSADWFNDCGILRLDIRSDYESEKEISEILRALLPQAFTLFGCSKIATKAVMQASQRRTALERLGFFPTEEKLIGHDGTEYSDYFVLHHRAVNRLQI